MCIQTDRGHTGKFLAKNNKFSNDIKPPPLQNIQHQQLVTQERRKKINKRNKLTVQITNEILDLPKIC